MLFWISILITLGLIVVGFTREKKDIFRILLFILALVGVIISIQIHDSNVKEEKNLASEISSVLPTTKFAYKIVFLNQVVSNTNYKYKSEFSLLFGSSTPLEDIPEINYHFPIYPIECTKPVETPDSGALSLGPGAGEFNNLYVTRFTIDCFSVVQESDNNNLFILSTSTN
jgi:hypothetical protein